MNLAHFVLYSDSRKLGCLWKFSEISPLLVGRAMLVWLGAYIFNWLALWLSILLYLSSPSDLVSTVIISPRTCLVKKVNHSTDVLPVSYVLFLKHVRTRLTILTGSKNNHKIKIAEALYSGQLAVSIPPLDCKHTFSSFPEMLTAFTTATGMVKGREGKVLKRRLRASHYSLI